jgi:hypothetical protein
MEKLEFNDFKDFESKLSEDKEFAAKVLNAVKVTETGKSYSDTIAKTYFDENKGSAHSHAWDMVDKALQGAGYEKPTGLKTSEWAAKIATEGKLSLEKLKNMEGDGAGKAQWLDEKVQLEKDYKAALLIEQNKYSELNGKITLTNRKSIIAKQLSAAGQPSAALDKATFEEITNFKMNQLSKNATEENGKIIWNDADGNPYKNGPLNAELDFVVNKLFGSILQKGTAGGGSQGGTNEVAITGNVLSMDASKFSTGVGFMVEFNKHTALQGIAKGSDEYHKLYKETKIIYKVNEMPES